MMDPKYSTFTVINILSRKRFLFRTSNKIGMVLSKSVQSFEYNLYTCQSYDHYFHDLCDYTRFYYTINPSTEWRIGDWFSLGC